MPIRRGVAGSMRGWRLVLAGGPPTLEKTSPAEAGLAYSFSPLSLYATLEQFAGAKSRNLFCGRRNSEDFPPGNVGEPRRLLRRFALSFLISSDRPRPRRRRPLISSRLAAQTLRLCENYNTVRVLGAAVARPTGLIDPRLSR